MPLAGDRTGGERVVPSTQTRLTGGGSAAHANIWTRLARLYVIKSSVLIHTFYPRTSPFLILLQIINRTNSCSVAVNFSWKGVFFRALSAVMLIIVLA
jgi:hypothetical protein